MAYQQSLYLELYHFCLLVKKTFKTGKHLTNLQTNVSLSHEPHSFCTFLLKDAELAR